MKRIFLIPIGSYLTLIKSFFIFTLLFIFPLRASDKSPALLSIGSGVFNIVKPSGRTAMLQVEYKWAASVHHIHPFAGFLVTSYGSSYFYAGAVVDVYVNRHLVVTPSFAPGLYFKGKGKNLGFPLEFRSSLGINYQFKNKNRLGIQFYHISNAKLGHKNPGTECLVLSYAFAIR